MDGTIIGETCKRWRGLGHLMFQAPIQDYFGVAYEKDLTVQHKLLLFAATFLIDYMYH